MDRRFQDALAQAIEEVPTGRVATCGIVATALGDVRAALAVSRWLREHPIPGSHRIVRADGRPIGEDAAARLRRERVPMARGRVARNRFMSVLQHVGFLGDLRREQIRLQGEVLETDDAVTFRTIGAVDVAYRGDRAFAAGVVCDASTLRILATASAQIDVDFPYVPTYLAFREFPPVREVFETLDPSPDILLVDGHGRLHPAHFGFACYAGVKLSAPTIGVAKSPLMGQPKRGDVPAHGPIPLELDGTVRGLAWVPPAGSRPLYISIGHRITLQRAFEVIQACTRGRLPEPMRIADQLSKEGKKKREEKVGRGALDDREIL